MAATTRLVEPARRGIATGIVNAGGSFGQFLFAPLAVGLTAAAGWVTAMQALGLFVLLALPAAWVLRAMPGIWPRRPACGPSRPGQAVRRAVADAASGCCAPASSSVGFHVAFIATHLPGVVVSCGLPLAIGAWSLAMVVAVQHVGSFSMGWAIGYQGGRWRMKSLLSLVYTCAAWAILAFLLAPKTEVVMLVFAAVLGFTFLSTVPPTAGLVAKFFGPANMATLFGIVMLRTRSVASSAPTSAASRSSGPAATTRCGSWTCCWPSARPWSTCPSARRVRRRRRGRSRHLTTVVIR